MHALRKLASRDKGSSQNHASGSNSSPPSQHRASASSGKLQVELSQATNIFSPGSRIEGTIRVPAEALSDAKALRIEFDGTASYLVKATPRPFASSNPAWTNDVAGLGQAFQEKHNFLLVKQELWDTAETKSADRPPEILNFALDVPVDKTCRCEGCDKLLPPTVDVKKKTLEREKDQSLIDIQYELVVTLERHGALKRNASLKIPMRCLHDTPPDYQARPALSGTPVRGQLKFAGSGSAAPLLECQLSHVRPSNRGGRLQYSLAYRLVSASQATGGADPLLPSIKLDCTITLTRRSSTRPAEYPGNARVMRFAPYDIAKGENQPVEMRSNIGEIVGHVVLPPNEYTAYSCAAEVEYGLHAHIRSSALLAELDATCPVHIPASVEAG